MLGCRYSKKAREKGMERWSGPEDPDVSRGFMGVNLLKRRNIREALETNSIRAMRTISALTSSELRGNSVPLIFSSFKCKLKTLKFYNSDNISPVIHGSIALDLVHSITPFFKT